MYEFKVGDVGKTRNGEDYKVIAVLNEGDVREGEDRIVAVADGHISTYQENGQYYGGCEDYRDLLPPKGRTVYLNVYPGDGHYGYDTEEAAKDSANVGEAIAVAVPVELPPGI